MIGAARERIISDARSSTGHSGSLSFNSLYYSVIKSWVNWKTYSVSEVTISAMSNSRRLNVLILGEGPQIQTFTQKSDMIDGGGIRGLSSLLILQALMLYINQSINALGEDATGQDSAVEPHEVFEFVGGTSTGGLIALMLGKLNMNLNQCIETYRGLSQKIFQKQHIRARITRGLAPARYSGTRLRECVRELLDERGFHKDLPMIRGLADEEDRMAW